MLLLLLSLWGVCQALFQHELSVINGRVQILIDCDSSWSTSCRQICRDVCPERVVDYDEGIICMEQIPSACTTHVWMWTKNFASLANTTLTTDALHLPFTETVWPPVTFRSALNVERFESTLVTNLDIDDCSCSNTSLVSSPWGHDLPVQSSPGPSFTLSPLWPQLIPEDTVDPSYYSFDSYLIEFPFVNNPAVGYHTVGSLLIPLTLTINTEHPTRCHEALTKRRRAPLLNARLLGDLPGTTNGPIPPHSTHRTPHHSTLKATTPVGSEEGAAGDTKSAVTEAWPYDKSLLTHDADTPYVSSLFSVLLRGLADGVDDVLPLHKWTWLDSEHSKFVPIHRKARVLCEDAGSACCVAECREICGDGNDITCLDYMTLDCSVEVRFVHEKPLTEKDWCRAPDRFIVHGTEMNNSWWDPPPSPFRVPAVQPEDVSTTNSPSANQHSATTSPPRSERSTTSRSKRPSEDLSVTHAVSERYLPPSEIHKLAREDDQRYHTLSSPAIAVRAEYLRVYYEGEGTGFDECGHLPQSSVGSEPLPFDPELCGQTRALNQTLVNPRVHYQSSTKRVYIDFAHHFDELGIFDRTASPTFNPFSDWAVSFAPLGPSWCAMDVVPSYLTVNMKVLYRTGGDKTFAADGAEVVYGSLACSRPDIEPESTDDITKGDGGGDSSSTGRFSGAGLLLLSAVIITFSL